MPALLFGLLSCSVASAVNIKLSGNQDPACTVDLICITDTSFTINTNDVGGGVFDALNQRNASITTLNFDLEYLDNNCPTGTPQSVSLSIDPTFFQFATSGLSFSATSGCTGTTAPDGQNIAEYLLAINFTPGIPDNFLFQIDLSNSGSGDPAAPGGWLPESSFQVVTAAPEPMAYGLAGIGLGLLLGLRTFQRRSHRRG